MFEMETKQRPCAWQRRKSKPGLNLHFHVCAKCLKKISMDLVVFTVYSSVEPGGVRSKTQQTIPSRASPIRRRVSPLGWHWDAFVMMQTTKTSPAVLCSRECLQEHVAPDLS